MERFNDIYRPVCPMKYATAPTKERLQAALESNGYCIQLKKDGSSYALAKDLNGEVHLYGDKISKKTGEVIDKIENVPHLAEWVEKNLPNGTQLLVEICFGETSKDVNTIMLSNPEKAISRQAKEKVSAYIFDILFFNGDPIYEEDFALRWKTLEKLVKEIGDNDYFSLAETHFENKEEHLAKWLADGEEGGVLKMLTSTGKTSAAHPVRDIGSRPARPMNTTFKVKQMDTSDVVIMDINYPSSEYTGTSPTTHKYRDENDVPINRLFALGMANGITIGGYDENGKLKKIGTVSSGFDDELRLDLAQNPNKFIGEVVEIQCMSKDRKDFTLRHPKFIQIREDKSTYDCTLSHIFS